MTLTDWVLLVGLGFVLIFLGVLFTGACLEYGERMRNQGRGKRREK